MDRTFPLFFFWRWPKNSKKTRVVFAFFGDLATKKIQRLPMGAFLEAQQVLLHTGKTCFDRPWGETKWVVLVGVDTLVCWLLLPKRDPGQIYCKQIALKCYSGTVTKGSPPKSSNITLSNSGLGCIIMWPEGMGKSYLKFAFANAKFWQMCDPFGTLFSTHDHTLYD